MKTITWLANAKLSAAFISIALLTQTQTAMAASRPDRPQRAVPPPDSRGGERPRQRPALGPEGVLNDEQRAQLRELSEANRERRQELERKIREARREWDEAIFAEKFNEKAIRKKAAAIAELEAERMMLRAKTFAKLRPSLTTEQIERIKNRRAELGPHHLGPRFRGPLAQRHPLRPEGRYHEPEGRLRGPEQFRPDVPPDRPPAPRPEGRLRGPGPGEPEHRFHESGRPEPQYGRPEFPRDEFERGRPEFRRDEHRSLRPETRRDDIDREREFAPPDRERRRPEPRREGDEPRPRKRPESPRESGPENRERERGESPPPGLERR